jgi:hypothetical protein
MDRGEMEPVTLNLQIAELTGRWAEPLFRWLAVVAAILVGVLWAVGPGNDPAATAADNVISVVLLGSVPLVVFGLVPGALWVKAMVFAIVFAAAVFAAIRVLPGDAVRVIEMWYTMLMVGGGCLVWWVLYDGEEPRQ